MTWWRSLLVGAGGALAALALVAFFGRLWQHDVAIRQHTAILSQIVQQAQSQGGTASRGSAGSAPEPREKARPARPSGVP